MAAPARVTAGPGPAHRARSPVHAGTKPSGCRRPSGAVRAEPADLITRRRGVPLAGWGTADRSRSGPRGPLRHRPASALAMNDSWEHRRIAAARSAMPTSPAAARRDDCARMAGCKTWYCAAAGHVRGSRGRLLPWAALDYRGLGDHLPAGLDTTARTVARDVLELMQDHLGVPRFHLAGHDWGGAVAFSVAAAAPAAVRSLAVVDVTVPGLGPDLSQGGRRWHHAFHMTPDLPEALTEGRERVYLGWFYRAFSQQAGATVRRRSTSTCRPTGRPGALARAFAYYRCIQTPVRRYPGPRGKRFRLREAGARHREAPREARAGPASRRSRCGQRGERDERS